MIIFIFSISHSFPSFFGLERSHNGIFLIFLIILLFFLGIFNYTSDRNGTEL